MESSPWDAIVVAQPHRCFDKVLAAGYTCRFRFDELPKDDWTPPGGYRSLIVEAFKGDESVGGAVFDCGPCFYCERVEVVKGYKRHGLGNAMYVFAETVCDRVLENLQHDSPLQTEAAKQLWAQPNRPFGNHAARSDRSTVQ